MSAAQWEQEVAVLRAEHRAMVGGDVLWQWSCSCGRSGLPTTRGRAAAGQDRHLSAERKKIGRRLTPDTPQCQSCSNNGKRVCAAPVPGQPDDGEPCTCGATP